MSKAVNEAMIEAYHDEFQSVESCIVVGPTLLTVAETEGFRSRLREADVKMRVVKNSLARIALSRTPMKDMAGVLDGPSAIIFGGEGALAISKLVVKEKKDLKNKLVLRGGFSDGEVLDAEGVEELSRAPSREELLSMILSGFYGPVNELARSMDGLLTEMNGLIEALAKEKGGAEGEGQEAA